MGDEPKMISHRLRIAHVTATFPPYLGGTGNVCYHNARELVRRGHEVHVFTATHPGASAQETQAGIAVHRLRPLLQIGNAPALPQLLWRLAGFDVVHLHYPFFGGEISVLSAGLNRTPLVITYHQDVFLSGWLGAAAKVLRQTIGRAALRAASRLLFTSLDYSRATYVRSWLRGREASLGVLPNGVDCARFAPGATSAALRRRYRLHEQNQVVLFVGGLDRAHAFKGVPLFLEALARHPRHVVGVLAGDGDLRPLYEQRAAALGIAQRLRFAGRVPDAALPAHYRLADVTVLPSTTMGEAFGLVLLESMACATPVIASNLPGVRTLVTDGVDGFLVEPDDVDDLSAKLATLLAMPPSQRRAMGIAGRLKTACQYSWENIGLQLESIYARVLAERTLATRQGREAS